MYNAIGVHRKCMVVIASNITNVVLLTAANINITIT